MNKNYGNQTIVLFLYNFVHIQWDMTYLVGIDTKYLLQHIHVLCLLFAFYHLQQNCSVYSLIISLISKKRTKIISLIVQCVQLRDNEKYSILINMIHAILKRNLIVSQQL